MHTYSKRLVAHSNMFQMDIEFHHIVERIAQHDNIVDNHNQE